MKIIRDTWRLVSYRLTLFLFNVAIWCVFHILPLGTGLLIRVIFDTLSGRLAPVSTSGRR